MLTTKSIAKKKLLNETLWNKHLQSIIAADRVIRLLHVRNFGVIIRVRNILVLKFVSGNNSNPKTLPLTQWLEGSHAALPQSYCGYALHSSSGARIWKFCNPDPIRNFFANSISNPYPKIKN